MTEQQQKHRKHRRRRQAVALRYEPELDDAPRVVASGQGLTAENIIARAKEAGVPVQEDPGLVEALCHVKLGQTIPVELYQAVAGVLAFIMSIDTKSRGGTRGGRHR